MNLKRFARTHWRNLAPALALVVVVVLAALLGPTITEGTSGPRTKANAEGSAPFSGGKFKKGAKGSGASATLPSKDGTDGAIGQVDGTTEPGAGGLPSGAPATDPPFTPPSHPIAVRTLTSGDEILKPGSYVYTDSVTSPAGGMLFVWVGGLVGGHQPSPAPTVSGAELGTFRMVETTVKKEDSPRRLSLFVATVPGHAVSGRIKIDFGQELESSEWIWAVTHVTGRSTRQVVSETEGGFVTNYSVSYETTTYPDDLALAGFLIGQNDQRPEPAAPMRQLVSAEGASPGVTLFLQWTDDSVASASVAWQQAGHSVAIATEIGV